MNGGKASIKVEDCNIPVDKLGATLKNTFSSNVLDNAHLRSQDAVPGDTARPETRARFLLSRNTRTTSSEYSTVLEIDRIGQ